MNRELLIERVERTGRMERGFGWIRPDFNRLVWSLGALLGRFVRWLVLADPRTVSNHFELGLGLLDQLRALFVRHSADNKSLNTISVNGGVACCLHRLKTFRN